MIDFYSLIKDTNAFKAVKTERDGQRLSHAYLIVSADGKYVYGYCVAADTGGFVKMGNTDVDLYMDNEDMCYDWGNRNIKIYVLN